MFEDELGGTWKVQKISFGRLVVHASNKVGVARSCARKLGVTHLGDGAPVDSVSDHGRIWNVIWKHGVDC